MSEIALLAGVSKSTVSRVLLKSPSVSDETRAVVEAVVRQQGYVPNINAARLKTARTNVVSIIVPLMHDKRQGVGDPFFMKMLAGLWESLSSHGYDVILSKLRAIEEGGIGRIVRQRGADGVILIGQSDLHDQLNRLAKDRLPLVVWGARLRTQHYASVSSDHTKGGYIATRHLLDLGRRRIAVFGNVQLPETRQRLKGYETALQEVGIEPDPGLLASMSFDRESAEQSIEDFVDRHPRFDAVFAMSDTIARVAVEVLQRRGHQIPRDVSVVGYDDLDVAVSSLPLLTTVRQDIKAACDALVTLLLEQIEGRPRRSITLPTSLVARQSSSG